MKVLAILHGSNVPPGVVGEEVERRGHEIDTWSLAWGTPPPAPVDDYGAVMIFGGSMHADQDDRHPWLREENFFLQRLLDLHIPVLGICLGAQLIAKAAHSEVTAMPVPEVGWVDVDTTAGTLQLQFAQNALAVVNTSIDTGSILVLTRIE